MARGVWDWDSYFQWSAVAQEGPLGGGLAPFPEIDLTEEEHIALYCWSLIDVFYTRWTERCLTEEEQAQWREQYGLIRANDETELQEMLRYLLDDATITLEAAMLRVFPTRRRFEREMGGAAYPMERQTVWRIYRTVHPESKLVAHLEPIVRTTGEFAPGRGWKYWWEEEGATTGLVLAE
jgi:hypothetical protein